MLYFYFLFLYFYFILFYFQSLLTMILISQYSVQILILVSPTSSSSSTNGQRITILLSLAVRRGFRRGARRPALDSPAPDLLEWPSKPASSLKRVSFRYFRGKNK